MFPMIISQVMGNTRANARRKCDGIENQKVPPKAGQAPHQVHNDPSQGNVTQEKFKTCMNLLAHAFMPQANREVVANPICGNVHQQNYGVLEDEPSRNQWLKGGGRSKWVHR